MEHPLLVSRGKPGAKLTGNLEAALFREAADASQERAEVLAFDIFHREEIAPVDFADVVHPAHIAMRHLPGDPHFLVEECKPVRIRLEIVGQELERDFLVEREILNAKDLASSR